MEEDFFDFGEKQPLGNTGQIVEENKREREHMPFIPE
jgi:hypothetical protein